MGQQRDLTYRYDYLGAGGDTLSQIADGSHPFTETLRNADRPMLILGVGALARDDGAAVLAAACKTANNTGMILDGWNGFNVLQTAASRVGGLMIGCDPGEGGASTSDELNTDDLGDAFIIYQGHHGDAGAHRADVILPGTAYTEKNAIFVNTEGRVQLAERAAFPPGQAREDWAIIRALSGEIGKPLSYDTQDALRVRIQSECPEFLAIDTVEAAEWSNFGKEGAIDSAPVKSPIDNFYMTDPISRASETMAKCVDEILVEREATGTDG